MPRKRVKEKALKFDGIPLTPEAVRKLERDKALKALAKAKKLEKEKFNLGFKYERIDSKTYKLK
ncbi:hypothetical protein EDL99_09970 [Ornithobacterium rhinotracheale]|uniref:hypothetical protein n=1 Tax=Ornithobacterium rhinotracheale TaxID=28251 RepID=UPI00129CB6FF|nr:hypothetical protein [Ornithobacterium rhinotracheale]MRJ09183.1 hypothetical protein [Ornithobacterium rhinotracheale]UOH77230.1 hypothetical protein MT996_08410 [Ornithobacterium rhinotracheale]UOH77655.1 hypothetical protein MT996_10670 [Ornithobacterium rhinotracheale]